MSPFETSMTAVTAADGGPMHSILIGTTEAKGDSHASAHSRRRLCRFAYRHARRLRGSTKRPTHDGSAFERGLYADRFCWRRALLSVHTQRQYLAVHRRTHGLHARNPNADGAVPRAACARNARVFRWRPTLTKARRKRRPKCEMRLGRWRSREYDLCPLSARSPLGPFMGYIAMLQGL
jgi:hypothetical protein